MMVAVMPDRANNFRPAGTSSLHDEGSADRSGAIVHDPQTHALLLAKFPGQTDTVVFDAENDFGVRFLSQANYDPAGLAVPIPVPT